MWAFILLSAVRYWIGQGLVIDRDTGWLSQAFITRGHMMDRGGGPFTLGWGWEAGLGGSACLVSPQPQQNITYLGTHRLEARQGTDCHTLVIHAAALGAGQHVHETVHLRRRATLCVE